MSQVCHKPFLAPEAHLLSFIVISRTFLILTIMYLYLLFAFLFVFHWGRYQVHFSHNTRHPGAAGAKLGVPVLQL